MTLEPKFTVTLTIPSYSDRCVAPNLWLWWLWPACFQPDERSKPRRCRNDGALGNCRGSHTSLTHGILHGFKARNIKKPTATICHADVPVAPVAYYQAMDYLDYWKSWVHVSLHESVGFWTRVDQCHCAWPIPAGFMPMKKREGHHKSSSSYWKGSGSICSAKCQVLVYSTANLTMHNNELTTMPLAGDQQRRIEAVLICFYVVSGQRVKHA